MQQIFLDVQHLSNGLKILIFIGCFIPLLAIWGGTLYLLRRWMKQRTDNFLMKARLETQEQTFADITANIHDNIGQTLWHVKFNLERATEQNATVPEMAVPALTEVIQDLRDLAHSASAQRVKEYGLARAIERDVLRLNKSYFPDLTFEVTDETKRLSDEAELLLYRFYQEALQNSIKHAKATEINVSLAFLPDAVMLSVADNGKGMTEETYGHGLKSIQQRAKYLGGVAIFDSLNDRTEVTVRVPLKKNLKM